MAEYSRVLKAAHAHFSRELANEVTQYRVLLAMMRKHNAMRYNKGGTQVEWRVRVDQHAFEGIDDMETIEYNREDTYEIAREGWREVVVHDAISRREVKIVQGKEQILDIYDGKFDTMKEDFSDGFSASLWNDGDAVGNTKRFHGIESIMGDDGATPAGAEQGVNGDTYAGLSTTLGAFGNSPGDTGYGAFSPYLANVSFNGGTWPTVGDEILRRCLLNTTFKNGPKGRPQLVTLNRQAWIDFLNIIDEKERFVIKKGDDMKLPAASLGFTSVYFDDCEITWDFDVPTSVQNGTAAPINVFGYGWNFNHLKMMFTGKQKDICEGNVYYDPRQRAYLFLIESLGNLFFWGPRHFFKIADYG